MRKTQYIRDSGIEARAQSLYSEALPYHNFNHIEDTLSSATIILERCCAENIRIDATVVYLALLFHDAGYQMDHKSLGHATKERYSAALAEEILRDHGVPQRQIEKTLAAIIATERDARFVSAEQKAVRAADLAGLAAPFEGFLKSSLSLKREHELLNNVRLSWVQWQEMSRQVLGFYLAQEIRLTSYFHDATGKSAFHRAVRDNLTRLLAEPNEPTLT